MLHLVLLLATSTAPASVAATEWCHSGLDPAFASAIETRFYDQLAAGGLKVITPKDIAMVLGIERQRQLLGCGADSSSCLAEIGGALGAEAVMYGCVAKGGSGFTVSMRAVTTRDAQAVASFSGRLKSEDAVQDWLDTTARQMAKKVLRALGGEALTLPKDSVGSTTLVARAQASRWSPPGPHRSLTLLTLGFSALAAGGGVAFGLSANNASRTLLSTQHSADEATRLVNSTHGLAIGANVAFGVAAAAAITSLVLFFVEPGLFKEDEEEASLGVTVDWLHLVARFP